LIAAAVMVNCGDDGDDNDNGTPDVPQPEAVSWGECPQDLLDNANDRGYAGPKAQCGTVKVPVNYQDKKSQTLDLFVIRIAASDTAQRIGALMFDFGGPGTPNASTGGIYGIWESFPADVRSRFDLVTWDPRGTQRSTEIKCWDENPLKLDQSPDTDAEFETLRAGHERWAKACAEDDAAFLLPYVRSIDHADDMESIRLAMGEDKLNFVGFSYGTRYAAHYLQRRPEHVRAFVLDSVVLPDATVRTKITGQGRSAGKAIDSFLAFCADPANECMLREYADEPKDAAAMGKLYDKLQTQFDALWAKTPPPTDGVAAALYGTVWWNYSWQDSWYDLDAALALFAKDGTLRNPNPDDPMAENNIPGINDIGDQYFDSNYDPYMAITCADGPRLSVDEYKQLYASLKNEGSRGYDVTYEHLACAYWPAEVKTYEPIAFEYTGENPVVIVGATGDGATAYEDSVEIKNRLGDKARLITFEATYHTPSLLGWECLDAPINKYLLDLTLPAEGLKCPFTP